MWPAIASGGLVMVGGHSRGVGKTLLIEQWLRARDEDWIAVKVSAHRHQAAGTERSLVEEAFSPHANTQAGRYLRAGATRAFLVRAPASALPCAASFVTSLRQTGARVIVESNRLVTYLHPDVLFFVIDPDVADWKPSSVACLHTPDVILCRHRRKSHHDSHIVTHRMGDSAAGRLDRIHRVALPRGLTPGFSAADFARSAG
jgi:hypothetical protein